MIRSTAWFAAGVIVLASCFLFFCNVRAQEELIFVGTINAADQLETTDGQLLEIAMTKEGTRLAEMAGRKVKVTGVIEEKDGTKIIEVTAFEVLNE